MSSPAGALERLQPRLYTPPFMLLCATSFLAFSNQMMVQPVVPILVLDRGGDATLAGLVIAAFSIPSVVVRPALGMLADRWSRVGTLLLGTALLAVSGLLYLIPVLAAVFVVRMLHGVGWAAFNTAAPSMLGTIAAPARRGEAAGIYSTMPGLANVLAPAMALLLYAAFGLPAAFIAAALAGALAFVTAASIRPPAMEREPAPPFSPTQLIEPRALLPMTVETLWTSGNALFFVFPPVVAATRGIPLDALPAYYLAAGVALVIGRASASRFLDRAERGSVILVGAGLGAAALLVAAGATSLPGLTLGGVLYALGMSAVSPATLALTLDRAAPRRLGAAMATYSLGYQLGVGVGAAVAGVAIDTLGFPFPYILGLLGPLGITAVVFARQAELGRPGRPADRPAVVV